MVPIEVGELWISRPGCLAGVLGVAASQNGQLETTGRGDSCRGIIGTGLEVYGVEKWVLVQVNSSC
jgi:hypothetical protein